MGEIQGWAVAIDRRSVVPARLSLAGSALFVVLLSLLHLVKPDLDPSWTPISAYALGPYGGLMTSAFVALGVSALALFVALLGIVQSRAGKIGLGFLVIGATGLFLAALFPMDTLATPMHEISTAGTIHSVGAVFGDAFPVAAALITWSLVRTRPEWATHRGPLIGAAVLTWVGMIAMTASMVALMPPSGELGPDVAVGWQGRAMMLGYAVWLMTAAWIATRTAAEG